MAKQIYVGFVRTKPLLQDVSRSAAGGMAAASAGVLALWLNADRPASAVVMAALAFTALSIPLLVASRYLADIMSDFELITRKAGVLSESLLLSGLMTALLGYFLLLLSFSKLIGYCFLAGLWIAFFSIRAVIGELENPTVRRKES